MVARLLTVERWVLASALVMALAAGVIWRTPHAAGSAAAGGLLVLLNFIALRRVVGGLVEAGPRAKAVLAVLLCLKMGLLLVAIWAAVRLLGLSPVGVGLGASALVIGVVAGSLRAPPVQAAREADAESP